MPCHANNDELPWLSSCTRRPMLCCGASDQHMTSEQWAGSNVQTPTCLPSSSFSAHAQRDTIEYRPSYRLWPESFARRLLWRDCSDVWALSFVHLDHTKLGLARAQAIYIFYKHHELMEQSRACRSTEVAIGTTQKVMTEGRVREIYRRKRITDAESSARCALSASNGLK